MPEEVKIIIKAVDQATEAFSKVSKAANDLGKRVSSISKQIASAGAAFTGFAAPAIAGLGMAVKAGMDFEQSMAYVSKTTGLTGKALDELAKGLTELSKRMPTAQTELAGIAQIAGQLGIQGKENILSFTRTVAMMGVAFEMPAEEAATAMAKMAAAFKMPIKDIEKLASSINYLGNTTAASEREIISAMYRIAPAAAQLGISGEAASAFAATIVATGQAGEEAGTRFNRALIEMSTNLNKVAEQMGVPVEEIKRRMDMGDALGVLLDYIKMLKNTRSATERLAKAEEVFGAVGAKAILTLTSNYDNLMSNLKGAEQAYVKGTSLQREYANATNTLAAKIQILRNNIKAIEITVFKELGKEINSAIKAFEAAIPTIKEFAVQFTQNLIPVMRQVGGVLLSLMEKFNSLSESNKALIAKISALAIGFAAVVGPLMMFIGAIGTGIGTLISFGGAITGLASTVVGKVGWMVGKFGGLISSIAPRIGAMLISFSGPIGVVIAAAGLLYLAWKKNFLGIKDFTHKILEYIKVLFEIFGVKFKNIWKIIGYNIHLIVVKAINGLLSRIESGLNKVIDMANSLIEALNSRLPGRFHIPTIPKIHIPKLALPKAPELEKVPELPKLKLPSLKDIFKLPSLKGFESEYLDRFMREAKEEAKKAEEAAKKAKESADKMKEQLKMPEIPSMPELPKLPELKRAAAPRIIHVDKVETNIHVEKIDESNIDHIADLISDAFLKKLTARTGYYP